MNFTFGSLPVGSKIDILKSNVDDEISYPSQVLDIIEPKEWIISGPIKQNSLVFIHKGENIGITYNIKNKGKHYFIAKVLSRSFSTIYALKIRRISEIEIIQQRNYYRFLATIEVNKEHTRTINGNIETLSEICESKDISGGGMKLFCNYEHKVGDEIICSFKIGDSLINTRALVVRVEDVDSFNYKFSIGISFLDIKEEGRDLIIKYIFEKQRILRLKGLI